MERVRCLLPEAKLSGSFWGEALYTAAQVINLSLVVVLQVDIPDRVWYGKDVSYSHLCVFDCKAFVHVSKDERSKLDAKTRECIFICYGHDEFGYRFYDSVEKKLVRSRDVIFVEDQTIEDIGKTKKSESPSTNDVVDTDGGEPECYEEAMESEHKNKWIAAMHDEMKSLHDNHTFELVKLPKGTKALQNR